MFQILAFLKNYKKITGVISILVALGSLYAVYDNIKDGWYQQGRMDAERAYEQEVIRMQQEHSAKLKSSLASYRVRMSEAFDAELSRIKEERVTEIEIKEVIEYVDREIEVPIECDSVPTDFSRLFNESIRKINGISTPL